MKLPSRPDLRFSGKSLGDSSLCGRGGWVSSTKTILKLISPVHKLCGFGPVSVNLICVPAFRCNCGYRSSINICSKAFSFQTSPCLEMSIRLIELSSSYLTVTVFVTHVSGEVEAESEDEDDDDDDCKKGSMDEVCISQVTQFKQQK